MSKTILLIGVSQSGKSTLGNFLVNEKVKKELNCFKIGDGNTSCTSLPQKASVFWEHKVLVPKENKIITSKTPSKTEEKEVLKPLEVGDKSKSKGKERVSLPRKAKGKSKEKSTTFAPEKESTTKLSRSRSASTSSPSISIPIDVSKTNSNDDLKSFFIEAEKSLDEKDFLDLHNEITVDKGDLCIIDTPGLGDSREQESENMWNLYKLFAEKLTISCVLLIIKFPSLIDERYRANLLFYKKMLPQVFQSNAIVVVTNYSQKESWHEQMENATGHNPKETLKRLQLLFKTALELNYDLPLFTIDSLSLKGRDLEHAQKTRKIILDRAFSLPSLVLDKLSFPKPIPFYNEDQITIKKLHAQKQGLLEAFEKIVSVIQTNQKEKQMLQKEISDISLRMVQIDNELLMKKNSDLCVVLDKTYHADSKALWWTSKEFHVETVYPIASKVWSGGNPTYSINDLTELKGTVSSSWRSTLNATLTIYTRNEDRWRSVIDELQIERGKKFNEQREAGRKYYSLIMQGSSHQKELEELKIKCDEIENEVMRLSNDFIGYEELMSRMNKK